MIKLLKNADVYTPEKLGKMDILTAGGKIISLEPDLRCYEGLPGVETNDLKGMITVPGLVDPHVHITGGGGEQGFVSRVPELTLTDFTLNGVTTVLGLFGTDGTTRSQASLLAKAKALNAEGITAFTVTGSYQYPSRTLTGSIVDDIMLLDPVIGVKTAMSDHRSSSMTAAELARLGSEARLGGLLSGKPGIVILHIGSKKSMLSLLFEVLENYDVPPGTILPTHCCRSPELAAQAGKYIEMGGMADFTASIGSNSDCANAVAGLIKKGIPAESILISSDAGGSLPNFDGSGKCISMGVGSSASLLAELRRLVFDHKIDLPTALLPFTKNPAKFLGVEGVKGCLAPGGDADILCFGEKFEIKSLYAKGRLMVEGGRPVVFGMFEKQIQ